MSDHEINAVAMFWDDLMEQEHCHVSPRVGIIMVFKTLATTIAPLEYAISLSSITTTEKPIRIEARIADDYLALDAKVSCDE